MGSATEAVEASVEEGAENVGEECSKCYAEDHCGQCCECRTCRVCYDCCCIPPKEPSSLCSCLCIACVKLGTLECRCCSVCFFVIAMLCIVLNVCILIVEQTLVYKRNYLLGLAMVLVALAVSAV